MLHQHFESAQPPTEPGEPCRMTDDCVPIDLYYQYLRPAPEFPIGGPRAYVLSPGGRIFSIPTYQLTTEAPFSCDSFFHDEVHRTARQVHVEQTRKASSAPGGKNRRETAKDRRERLDRWDAEIR